MPKKSVREMTALERLRYSLAARTFRAVFSFAVILGAAAIAFGFYLYTTAIEKEYTKETWKLSQTTANILDKTVISKKAQQILYLYQSISPRERGDGTGKEYLARYDRVMDNDFELLRWQMHRLQEDNDAVACYIAALDTNTNRLIYLVDSDPGSSFCPPGSWDEMEPKYIATLLSRVKMRTTGDSVKQYEEVPAIVTNLEAYGYRCTAGSKLFTEGSCTVMLFVDKDMNYVAQAGKAFLLQYILLLLIITIICVLLFVFYLRKTVVRPINEMALAAYNYAKAKQDPETAERHFAELNIRTGDEIENLAFVLKDMENDLAEYIRYLTRVTAERERVGTELALATRIQADMLPHIFPPYPERRDFDIYAMMNPAKEVGGDFYDFFLVDQDHLALVMADVSGKGVPAALFMMVSKILVKNYVMTGRSPQEALRAVNEQICTSNTEEMFVTIWLGILDVRDGTLVAANAGHEYPVLQRPDGVFEIVKDRHGFVIGGMPGMKYKEYELKMTPGSSLFIYTDGIPEACNGSNEQFGMDRLLETLNRCCQDCPQEILEEMEGSLGDFVGPAEQFDDVTMLCVRYNGAPEEGSMRKVLSDTEFTVDAKVENLEKVTNLINEQLEAADCPMKAQLQLDVAIDEIFSNIAQYAYAPGTGQVVIRIRLLDDPKEIQLTFADRGMPFDPTAAEDPDTTLSADERQIGGLGIFLVKKTMDSVRYEYRDGQNIMTIGKCF